MNRIRISPTQFKVSRPGFNVDTADPADIAFDGFAGRYNGLYMQGSSEYDGSWSSETTGNVFLGAFQFTRRYKTISLGKTFAQPPQVIVGIRPIGDDTVGSRPTWSAQYNAGSGSFVGGVAGAFTTNTDLVLYIDTPDFGVTFSVDWEFNYIVFHT
jgi:hypothetical protein